MNYLRLVAPPACPWSVTDELTIPPVPKPSDKPHSKLFPGFETFEDPDQAARYDVKLANTMVNGAWALVEHYLREMWTETGRNRAQSRVAIRREIRMLRRSIQKLASANSALSAVLYLVRSPGE